MKLPDLLGDAELNDLRRQMGAKLILWKPIDQLLDTEGIEVEPSKVTITSQGTHEYEGRTVVVYIRDQIVFKESSTTSYRFHIADCVTLHQMQRKGKYERYVVATRRDGEFIVNFFKGSELLEENVKRKLYVCIHCLRRLNYKGYRGRGELKQTEIRNSFNLEEFFEMYSPQITRKPTHTDIMAPLNSYTPDWDRVSLHSREQAEWKCSKCRTYLGDENKRRFLHVHHIDGLKYNNREQNLKVLCIMCHADIDDQLKYSPDYAEYQQTMQLIESA